MNVKTMICACEAAKIRTELALSYLKEGFPCSEDNILSIEFPAEYIDAFYSLKEAIEYLDAFIENYSEEKK